MLAFSYVLLLALVYGRLANLDESIEEPQETVEEPNVEEFYVADEMNAMCEKNVRCCIIIHTSWH